MTERMQVYKCEVCGNIVEVIHAGAGKLTCCGQEMKPLEEKTADSSIEKHVPFIERKEGKYVVTVGRNAVHPMQEEHFIESNSPTSRRSLTDFCYPFVCE